jgi:DNA-binding response OmpR family regulator
MSTAAIYRALIVDDEASVRQLVTRALSHAGFICELASDGRDALDMARVNQYDVVVTDLKMPEMHGHALILELLAMPQRPAILVVTGVAEPRIATDLHSRGIEEILFKPFDVERLATRAQELAEKRARGLLQIYEEATIGIGISGRQAETFVGFAPQSTDDSFFLRDEEFPAVFNGDWGSDSENHTLQAVEEPQPIATRVAQLSESLPEPPNKYDGYSTLSNNSFSAQELVAAIETDPKLAWEVMSLSNRALYHSHLTLTEFELGLASKKHSILWLSFAFAMGILWGWLFGWLQASQRFLD